MNNNEVINAPDYYLLPDGRQLEEFIEKECLDFAMGSALKYLYRAGKKHGESAEKDRKKAEHYVKFTSHGDEITERMVWKQLNGLLARATKKVSIQDVLNDFRSYCFSFCNRQHNNPRSPWEIGNELVDWSDKINEAIKDLRPEA